MLIKTIIIIWLAASPLFSLATDYYVTTSDLNLRTGPGMGYPVSFTLEKGAEVVVLSKGSNWYQISYSGTTGYVHSRFLKFSRTIFDVITHHTDQQKAPYFFIGVVIILVLIIVFVVVYVKLRDRKLLKKVTPHIGNTKTTRRQQSLTLKNGWQG